MKNEVLRGLGIFWGGVMFVFVAAFLLALASPFASRQSWRERRR